MKQLRRRLKAWFFNLIRPLLVPDCDSNEDYLCMWCSEPVLRRWLYCSDRCGELGERQLASADPYGGHTEGCPNRGVFGYCNCKPERP